MWEKRFKKGVKTAKIKKSNVYFRLLKLAKEHFGEEFKDVYCGGTNNLIIKWVPVGTRFRIDEYDGSESIIRIRVEND